MHKHTHVRTVYTLVLKKAREKAPSRWPARMHARTHTHTQTRTRTRTRTHTHIYTHHTHTHTHTHTHSSHLPADLTCCKSWSWYTLLLSPELSGALHSCASSARSKPSWSEQRRWHGGHISSTSWDACSFSTCGKYLGIKGKEGERETEASLHRVPAPSWSKARYPRRRLEDEHLQNCAPANEARKQSTVAEKETGGRASLKLCHS